MGSAIHVYAIVRGDAPLADVAGAGMLPALGLVPCRGLAAVTEQRDQDGAAVSMRDLLRHEGVVECVRRSVPALPVRFGTVFRDVPAVASALASRYEPLTADLAELGDKVEMGLTALWAAAAPARDAGAQPGGVRGTAGSGAAWLRARAAELRCDDALEHRARAESARLAQALDPISLRRRVSVLPSPRVAVRATYLLEPAGVRAFRAAFDALRHGASDLRLVLTGPWPPYSFVRRTGMDEGDAPARDTMLARLLNEAMRERRG